MLTAYLRQRTAADWSAALETLVPEIHPVDRDATRIWCAFHPLALAQAFESTDDPQRVVRQLRIDGNPRLVGGQIDSSHHFLFGHRHWPDVKAVLNAWADRAEPRAPRSLVDVTREVSAEVAERAHVEARLLIGITFVGVMTLRQAGADAFRDTSQAYVLPAALPPVPPDAVVARRARDDSQGALGFLRSAKRYSVVFDEATPDARFPILESQHLTTASASDTRNYMHGPRRFQEGPIPAQCRSATCGTCWVGVLGGREKLSEIEPYEARRLREFGYSDAGDAHPFIRLACQARASGNVTIVIPSWHGFVARLATSAVPATTGADR